MNSQVGQKIILPISDCLPGMVIMQPIIDIKTGNIIVAKDSELTRNILDRIQHFHHTEIWVKAPSEENLWPVDKRTLKKYIEYAHTLEKVLGKFNKDAQVAIKEIKELAKSILSTFNYDFELLGCVSLMKNLQKDIYIHSMNVTFLAILTARWCKLDSSKLEQVILSGLLHDMGKLNLPERLLFFKEDFSVEEALEYKRHPIYSYEKIKEYKEIDREISKAVLAHHERCDGSGYPLNIKMEDMTTLTKILGLVDEYERLRKFYHIFDIVRILKGDNLKKFDINILTKFCENIISYYIGAYVRLNTSEEAEVVFIHSHCLHRPIVKVKDAYIDLYNNPSIKIEEIL